MNLPANFLNKTAASTCIVWTGAVQSSGYGSVGIGGSKTALAHRVAWEHVHGPIPEGMTVDHLCRYRLCVNVDHLELVTAAENVSRRAAGISVCSRGHLLEGANLIVKKRGHLSPVRNCRTCRDERRRVWQASA